MLYYAKLSSCVHLETVDSLSVVLWIDISVNDVLLQFIKQPVGVAISSF